MGDARWCPRCGSEFQPGYTTCPDCGAVLIDELPAPVDSPAVQLAGHEPVAYELQDWSEANRDSLEWMLGGLAIPFEWDPPGVLIVPESRADEVDGFLDYLDAGADGTTTDGEAGPGAPVAEEVVRASGAEETSTEDRRSTATPELLGPVTWLAPRLDELRRAYLVLRADHDPDTAFEQTLEATLDAPSRARLAAVFDGDENDADGADVGERARQTLRDALERQAWTIPGPAPETTRDR